MSEAVLDARASFVIVACYLLVVTPEARGQDASSEHESLDDNDVEYNIDLYIFNHEVAQS